VGGGGGKLFSLVVKSDLERRFTQRMIRESDSKGREADGAWGTLRGRRCIISCQDYNRNEPNSQKRKRKQGTKEAKGVDERCSYPQKNQRGNGAFGDLMKNQEETACDLERMEGLWD